MELVNARSLRTAYLEWVEDQIEAYKESVSRDDLLHLADKVIQEQRVTHAGQYQLSELVLCDAVNRKIFRMLKLPGYRNWSQALLARRAAGGPPLPPAVEMCPIDTADDLTGTHAPLPAAGTFHELRAMAMV